MKAIPEDVSDGVGHKIGTVEETMRGRNGRTFWAATALDGCHLGVYARRLDAEGAVFDDNADGRPRCEDGRLWQAIHEGRIGIEPHYLGRVGFQ